MSILQQLNERVLGYTKWQNDIWINRRFCKSASAMLILPLISRLMAVNAHATDYRVDIREADVAAPAGTAIVCADDAKQPCAGQIKLMIAGRPETIGITALFKLGNAYFRFRLGNAPLLTYGRSYYYMSVGENMTAHTATVALSRASQQTKEDDNGILVRPIVRYPPEIAKIQIIVDKMRY